MRTLIVVIAILSLAACAKKITPSNSISWLVEDSTHVGEVARQDTIYVPGDTIRLTQMIDCDKVTNKPKPTSGTARSIRGGVAISVDKTGKLVAIAVCDSLASVVTVMDKEIFRLRHSEKKEKEVIVEYRTRKIDIFCRYISGGLLLLIIGYVVAKVRKVALPF